MYSLAFMHLSPVSPFKYSSTCSIEGRVFRLLNLGPKAVHTTASKSCLVAHCDKSWINSGSWLPRSQVPIK